MRTADLRRVLRTTNFTGQVLATALFACALIACSRASVADGWTVVFQDDFTAAKLEQATDAAVQLLNEDDGLKHAADLIRSALGIRLRETAYALACEVVAADGKVGPQTLDMLEFVQHELHLDSLIATAIGRGVRARYQRTDGS